jgi:hypothetical protein
MNAAAATRESCSQAEFARSQDWSKSYVTKLKQEGRLVFTAEGLVDIAASLAKIRESTTAPERASPPAQTDGYSDAAERDKYYASELKRLEYEAQVRKVLQAGDVVAVITDAATRLRGALESWPDRLSPLLAAAHGDEDRIRGILAEEVEMRLAELSRGFNGVAGGLPVEDAGPARG